MRPAHSSPPRGERERRRAVEEIVQPDRRQPGQAAQLVEHVRDIHLVQRRAVPLSEGQVMLFPLRSEALSIRVLHGQMPRQHQSGVLVDRDRVHRLVRLRQWLAGLPAPLHDLMGDPYPARDEVDRRAPLPARSKVSDRRRT